MIHHHGLPLQVRELTVFVRGDVQHVRMQIAGDDRSGIGGDQRTDATGARAPLNHVGVIERSDGRQRGIEALLVIFVGRQRIVLIGMFSINRDWVGHARSITRLAGTCLATLSPVC